MTSHQVLIKLSCMLCKLSLLNQKDSIMYGTYITKPIEHMYQNMKKSNKNTSIKKVVAVLMSLLSCCTRVQRILIIKQ